MLPHSSVEDSAGNMFPEKNPPDVPILPGPDYKYLNSTPPPDKTQFRKSSSLGFRNGIRYG